MIFILLTILCSTTIALIIKHSSTKMEHPIVLLAGNYFIAGSIAAYLFLSGSKSTYSIETLLLGWIVGLLFLLSFFVFAKAIAAAGTALATVSSRLSVVIPVILSIIFFKELPGMVQISGLLVTVITIVLFYFSLKRLDGGKLNINDFIILFLVLIGIGIGDFSMKIFQQLRFESEKNFFLLNVFGSACVYSFTFILFRKIKVEKKPLLRGFVLGFPNVFSSFFLISALHELPAYTVYPLVNVGIIIFTSVAAAMIWRERLNFFGKLALYSGIIAIILFGING